MTDRATRAALLGGLETLAYAFVAMTSLAIDEATHPAELTFQQWRVLVVVGSSAAGVRVSELASRIAASGPSTSRLARRLDRRGFLTHSIDPDDRRAVRLRLTPTGQAIRAQVVAHRRALIEEAIGDRDLSTPMARELTDLATAFKRWI